jgi:DNA-directed RNA polymerase subunit RPC12/RpoP
MRIPYVCLRCGWQFYADRSGPTWQCSHCRSTAFISIFKLLKTVERAKELMRTTPLGAIPAWDTFRAILEEVVFGGDDPLIESNRRLKFVDILNLESLVWLMAVKNMSFDEAWNKVYGRGQK